MGEGFRRLKETLFTRQAGRAFLDLFQASRTVPGGNPQVRWSVLGPLAFMMVLGGVFVQYVFIVDPATLTRVDYTLMGLGAVGLFWIFALLAHFPALLPEVYWPVSPVIWQQYLKESSLSEVVEHGTELEGQALEALLEKLIAEKAYYVIADILNLRQRVGLKTSLSEPLCRQLLQSPDAEVRKLGLRGLSTEEQ